MSRRHALAAAAAVAAVAPPAAAAAAPSPAPDPNGALQSLAFDVRGHGEVRTGIRGRVPISGTFDASYDRQTGQITGSMALTPARANVRALGVPVTADTDWVFTEPISGSWQDGVMALRISAKIRHPRLSMLGIPVAGGQRCMTREPSVIELRSEQGDAAAGPQAAVQLSTSGAGYTISALSGCGLLDGLLSAVAAGGGNQAVLALTPRTAAP